MNKKIIEKITSVLIIMLVIGTIMPIVSAEQIQNIDKRSNEIIKRYFNLKYKGENVVDNPAIYEILLFVVSLFLGYLLIKLIQGPYIRPGYH